MTAYQSLVSINGTSSQVPAADSLLVGTSVDTVANSGANSILSVGGTNATAITITPTNGAGTGDITIDASVAGGSSNLLTLDGANVTVQTNSNGAITLAPNNGTVYIGVGGADVDLIVGSAGPANALFVQGSDGFVGINTNAPSVGFDVRAQTLFRNPSDSTTALEVQNAATTTVFDVDTTNARVGIGTNAPSTALHVDSNAVNTTAILTIENTAGDFQVFRVDATPESSVTGSVGDLANDTTNGVLYLKTSGSATNTGWTALATGSSSLTVGTTPIVSGTANRILYQDGSNVLQESGNLTFDGSIFSVNANSDALVVSVVAANSNNGASSGQFINITSGPTGLFQFGATGTGTNFGSDIRTGGAALLISSGGYDLKHAALSANFRWYDSFSTSGHLMSLTPTGLGINTDTPTAKLDVRGTVLAQSTSNSATAFQVQTSGAATVLNVDTANERVGIGTTSPDWQLDVEGSTAAVVSRVYNTSSGAGAIAQGRVSANGTDVGALVNAYGSANGGTQFQSISLNDAASFTTDTGVANLFISTRNATAPIHIGTNSDVIGPRAIEIAANQGNVTVNPDGANGVDFSVLGGGSTNALYVDVSANAVGIGTNAPSRQLEVAANAAGGILISGSVDGARYLEINNSSSAAAGQSTLLLRNDTNRYAVAAYNGQGFTTSGSLVASQTTLLSSGSGGILIGTFNSGGIGVGDIVFNQNGTATTDEKFRISSSEVVVNDAVQDVDFRVEGVSNTDVLHVDASANAVGIGLASPSTVLHVDSNAADTTAILTLENSGGDFQVFRVDATPESSVTGSVGDLANDTTNGVLYLKTSGTATNTGWTALSTGGGGPATGVEIPFNTSTVATGEVVYCWAANSANPASAAAPAAPEYRTARVIGICTGAPAVAGTVAVSGLVDATFIGGLTFAEGDPVYLSKTGGSLTTDVSSGAGFGTGDAVAEIGIVTNVLSYNGTSNLTARILIQPKAITIL